MSTDLLASAIHDTAHKTPGITAEELASKIGISYQVFINKTNPNCETHNLTDHQLLAMMIHSKNPAIYHAMGTILRNAGVLEREGGQKSVLDALMDKTANSGSLFNSVREAIADNKITAHERSEIAAYINAERVALEELENSVNACVGKVRLAAEGGN